MIRYLYLFAPKPNGSKPSIPAERPRTGGSPHAWLRCAGSKRNTRRRVIDRRAAENDYRINVEAELGIEFLNKQIAKLRERKILKLTEAVRTPTKLLEKPASCTRVRRGRRTAIIMDGYRLDAVTSFPICRAEFHASSVPRSYGARRLGSYAARRSFHPPTEEARHGHSWFHRPPIRIGTI
jgi:hypothetical protein